LVGDREAIQEAAIRGAGKAAELIDLTSIKVRTRAWARPMSSHSSPLKA
jgi:glutamate formiminotransferase